MPIHNADVATIFEEIADLLELEQANQFRVRAYRNAARTVRGLAAELHTMIKQGEDLTELPGIGEDLSDRICEIVATGSCDMLTRLRKKTPHVLVELLSIAGLGPKRVRALSQELGIRTMDDLATAIEQGRVSGIAGFGKKSEDALRKALEVHLRAATASPRLKLAIAIQYAEPFAQYLRLVPGVRKVVIAGSYRRCQETVGDIDILVTAADPRLVIRRFTEYDEVASVPASGTTRSMVLLKSKLQVDLRVIPEESYGAALVYFTGSKAHNIAMRTLGIRKGLKVNEYGVFRGSKRIAGETEESVYKAVGLSYIPPEMRENRGEIELALQGPLPKLIELSDLKGDLHAHTRATDGKNSLSEMVAAAKKAGLEYIAISDHSKHIGITHGFDAKRLLAQIAEIDALNQKLDGITVLKSIEVDILEDGTLDLPNDVLRRLDLVIASVHTKFNLSSAAQTRRICKAMDNPYVTIIGHPSGRLIGEREPYDIDMQKIIRHAKLRGCILELNAQPDRLDLTDVYCRMAKEEGVLVGINSDAHSVHDFANLRFGIGQARRGWLEKKDVLNTRTLAQLQQLLSKKTVTHAIAV
jgi:DNA polymerase (family X)